MCVRPCLVFPSPPCRLGLTKRFGRPRAVILMAAKPVEPVESVTRSEVESLRHDRIKSNAETYTVRPVNDATERSTQEAPMCAS